MCVSAFDTWPYNAFKMSNHRIPHGINKTKEDTKPWALLVLTSQSSTQGDIRLQGCFLFLLCVFFLFNECKNKVFKVYLPQNQISLFLTATSLQWYPHLQHLASGHRFHARTTRSDVTGGCLKDADFFKTALELPWLFPPQKIILSQRLYHVAFAEHFEIYQVLLCSSALPGGGIIIIAITVTMIIIIMDLL